jgi:hypothetical protein
MCVFVNKPIINKINSKHQAIFALTSADMRSEFIIEIAMTEREMSGSYPLHLSDEFLQFSDSLSRAESFTQFKNVVSKEIKSLGFHYWNYLRLDVSLAYAVINSIGTFVQPDSLSNHIHNFDLMLERAKTGTEPVYQSVIEQEIQRSGFITDRIERCIEIIDTNKASGHTDRAFIPIQSQYRQARVVFGTTSKHNNPTTFSTRVQENLESLQLLGSAADSIGCKRYSKHFTHPYTVYDRVVSSLPFVALKTLIIHDFTDMEAAQHLEISIDTLERNLSKIKTLTDTKTNQGAYIKLLNLGYSFI